jgi:hypothetical protein
MSEVGSASIHSLHRKKGFSIEGTRITISLQAVHHIAAKILLKNMKEFCIGFR